jgi:hypothetical protein
MGLRERERDPGLPERAGEVRLRPPEPAELLELVHAVLQRPGTPALARATWEYARWKPGVSITSTYRLVFEDGAEELVVAKRYVDGKERTLRFHPRNEELLAELSPRLRPHALLAERSLALWVPPADRVLRGLPALLDRRKLGHFLTRSGVLPAGLLKKRRTEFALLRYKPERRAVYRLDLRLRSEQERQRSLAARVLPPAQAARLVEARRALAEAGAELAPAVLATNQRQGYLLEPWLALTSSAPDSFAHAREAGAVLARLHALPAPQGLRAVADGLPGDLDALFAVDERLARAPRPAAHPAPGRVVFCHGDFHPDQVARGNDGRWLLLDLDLLGAGDPAFDLGCWIADAIVESQRPDLEAASAALLEGYRSAGGQPPERARLAAFTAAELACRAGSTIRRLEREAVEKARFALEAARALPAG